ncbi:MAG TPA: LLM class flavin-dependent oxidoreductase [Acidimicrobiales bacterium]|nr:LLM class flavin-dependent oxidoreductase [Acidimicrobiales bacterium]
MSRGRVEVGLGAGWYEDEHDAYGLPFPAARARYDLLEDQLEILQGVWSARSEGLFDFTGRTCSVHLEPGSLRPFQRPRPPIILGGAGGPRNARLAATFADEFNAPFVPLEQVKVAHGAVRRCCEAAGRDPTGLMWSVAQVLCCGRSEAEVAKRAGAIGRDPAELRKNGLAGSPQEVLDKMATFAEAGVRRFYLQVLDLSDLDHLRLVAEDLLPQYRSL